MTVKANFRNRCGTFYYKKKASSKAFFGKELFPLLKIEKIRAFFDKIHIDF